MDTTWRALSSVRWRHSGFAIVLLICISCLSCDLGEVPTIPEPPPDGPQPPWIRGNIVTLSYYPRRAVGYCELTLSWDSGDSTITLDTSSSFQLEGVPRTQFNLRATRSDYDTVSVFVDLTIVDTARMEIGLTQIEGFVPGEIIVGLCDTVSLRTLVSYATAAALTIKSASTFEYSTDSLSADSAQTIKNILALKPYLRRSSILVKDNRVRIGRFQNLTLELLGDWERECLRLGFRALAPLGTRHGLLGVNPGTEAFWAQILGPHPMVRFVELNGIGHIDDGGDPQYITGLK